MVSIPLISIIIPVYKVEKYLPQCIDSILSQTFTNFEVLLIDDGSPDNSSMICDDYARKDSRVRVYHKENGGVSSARNWGIDNAGGKWICFIDADDWLEPETLEECIADSEKYEMIRFGMKYIFSAFHSEDDRRIDESWNYTEYFSRVVSRQTTLGVCGGIYLRSVFVNNNIRFNSRYALGEDWLVLFTYLKHIENVKIIDKPYYNYNKMNQESATTIPSVQKFMQLNEIASIICYDNHVVSKVGYKETASLKANICGTCISSLLIKRSPLSVYKSILRDIRKHNIYPCWKEIFRSTLDVRYKLVLLGFSFWAYSYPKLS